jgi:hypothetical protein
MPKRLARLTVVPRRIPQLQLINEKIARLAAIKPWNDIYRSFSAAAQLANDAVEAAEELQQMPGADFRLLQPAFAFWVQVRDFNQSAGLKVAGGNRTLAEALVTFRLLQELQGIGS